MFVFALFSMHGPTYAMADLDIDNYYSPRNRERPVRRRTHYIILHTTEGPKAGSLKKIHRNGESHYFVDTAGHVYRIIEKKRIALHAGRSMWRGKTNLDNLSIGIEIVGYHNKDITPAQYKAVKELLSQLQRIYRLPDDRVLTHSMIAYGVPNAWHRQSHRGRKRCAMLLAKRSRRRHLGLDKRPSYDPDVKAHRLIVADPYLAEVLYGSAREQDLAFTRLTTGTEHVISANRSAWDIARDRYRSSHTLYVFPDGKERKGNQIRNWKTIPAGTRVVLAGRHTDNQVVKVDEIGRDAKTAVDIAGNEVNSMTTIYFLPDGRVRRGDEFTESELLALPDKTRILVGYVHGGHITAKRSAYDVCGKRWNFPATIYRFPDGSIRPGNMVHENRIPKHTLVFFRN